MPGRTSAGRTVAELVAHCSTACPASCCERLLEGPSWPAVRARLRLGMAPLREDGSMGGTLAFRARFPARPGDVVSFHSPGSFSFLLPPQRYILRLLFMIPTYSFLSFLALVYGLPHAMWFETIRDWCARLHAPPARGSPGGLVIDVCASWCILKHRGSPASRSSGRCLLPWRRRSKCGMCFASSLCDPPNVSSRSYESWIIYNFLALMFAYTGGPGHVVTWMEGQVVMVRATLHPVLSGHFAAALRLRYFYQQRPPRDLSPPPRQPQPSWHAGTCCLPPLPIDGKLLRYCKRGALQFVVLKPFLALTAVRCEESGSPRLIYVLARSASFKGVTET